MEGIKRQRKKKEINEERMREVEESTYKDMISGKR